MLISRGKRKCIYSSGPNTISNVQLQPKKKTKLKLIASTERVDMMCDGKTLVFTLNSISVSSILYYLFDWILSYAAQCAHGPLFREIQSLHFFSTARVLMDISLNTAHISFCSTINVNPTIKSHNR